MLKKKDSQLSFLHCYHHAAMVLSGYISSKWLPGGPPIILGIINCLVHTVMYFYYFVTSFKPELKQSIWWKKHITHVQLLQFTILFGHFSHSIFVDSCSYPKVILWILLIQDTFMLFLFSDFYIKVYLKKDKKNGNVKIQ